MPLTKVSTTASTRNCRLTSRRLAPMALRRPISRVRSVTVVSIMFMMPMPPTTSEMPAMAASSSVSVRVVEVAVEARSAWLITEKSAELGSVMPWRCEQQVGDIGLQLGHALLVDRLDADAATGSLSVRPAAAGRW